MSGTQTALLGFIAGITIFLGLPIGRIRNLHARWRVLLNGLAAGVLAFLVFEFFEYGIEGIEEGSSGLRATLFALGLFGTFGGLFVYGRWMRRSAGVMRPIGPGAAATAEMQQLRSVGRTVAQKLALLVAIGIGLHNLAEGLAIGQSAASGKYSLAVLLIIGFALHNATEGFGIVGPMLSANEQPSWSFILLLGAIGGLPVFVGTIIGQVWVNQTLEVAVLGLATGSVLYVLYEVGRAVLRQRHYALLALGVALGIAIGLGTELVIYAGAGS